MMKTEITQKKVGAWFWSQWLNQECDQRDNKGTQGQNNGDDPTNIGCSGVMKQTTLYKVLASKTALGMQELTLKGYIKTAWDLFRIAFLHKKGKGTTRTAFIVVADSLNRDKPFG